MGKCSLHASENEDINEDIVFVLASATKIVTAIAALRLVERGTVDLDDGEIVARHLPELCQQQVITSAPGESLTFETRKEPITIRQLLTHTSGSGADIIDPRLVAWRKSRGEAPMHLSAALPEAIAMPSLFQPGEGWAYGGGNDWIGLLISRLAGETFGSFLRREVFDVVGCDFRIGFSRAEIENMGGAVVQVVKKTKEGLEDHRVPEQKSERGGGGLFSSVANFIKILSDLVALEPKLLRKDTLDTLFAPQLKEGSTALSSFRNQSYIFRAMTGALTGPVPPTSLNHALGGLLVTGDLPVLGKSAQTMTWGGAFGSMWFVNREQGVAAFYGGSVWMTLPGPGPNMGIMGAFVKSVWEKHGEERDD